ncbi:MAG: hypothetical protein WBE26_17255, partial [Phycisphaerae bacterium]
MPLTDPNRRRRWLTRRIAGLWMVVLALGLAAAGVVLALQQARSLASRLMAPAEAQARVIADTALKQFNNQLYAGLRAVADHLQAGADRRWEPPSEFPGWIDGLFTWDGRDLEVIAPPSDGSEELSKLVETRLEARLQRSSGQTAQRVELLYESLGTLPVVIACTESVNADGKPILIAGRI